MLNIRRFAQSRALGRSFSTTNANPITIYGFPFSQPTRAVLMLCESGNVPYEMKLVEALKGETRSKEFAAINPAKQVPCISDGNAFPGVLGESCAILQYIAESRNLTGWYPTDPVVRSRINFWMHWHHSNTRVGTMGILVGHFFPGSKLSEGIPTATKKFAKSIEFLESQLQDNLFIAGTEKPTIADLTIIVECDQLSAKAFNHFDFSPYPKVLAWMNKVATEIAAYEPIFEPVKTAGEKARAPK